MRHCISECVAIDVGSNNLASDRGVFIRARCGRGIGNRSVVDGYNADRYGLHSGRTEAILDGDLEAICAIEIGGWCVGVLARRRVEFKRSMCGTCESCPGQSIAVGVRCGNDAADRSVLIRQCRCRRGRYRCLIAECVQILNAGQYAVNPDGQEFNAAERQANGRERDCAARSLGRENRVRTARTRQAVFHHVRPESEIVKDG